MMYTLYQTLDVFKFMRIMLAASSEFEMQDIVMISEAQVCGYMHKLPAMKHAKRKLSCIHIKKKLAEGLKNP